MEVILYGIAGLSFLYAAYFIIVLVTMEPPNFDDWDDEYLKSEEEISNE